MIIKELVLRPIFGFFSDANIAIYLILFVIFILYGKLIHFSFSPGWKKREVQLYVCISIVFSLLICLLLLGFKGFTTFNFKNTIDELNQHLTLVFGEFFEPNFCFSFMYEFFIIGIVFLAGVLSFGQIPSIIQFAHCYLEINRLHYKYQNHISRPRPIQESKSDAPNPPPQPALSHVDEFKAREKKKIDFLMAKFITYLALNMVSLIF